MPPSRLFSSLLLSPFCCCLSFFFYLTKTLSVESARLYSSRRLSSIGEYILQVLFLVCQFIIHRRKTVCAARLKCDVFYHVLSISSELFYSYHTQKYHSLSVVRCISLPVLSEIYQCRYYDNALAFRIVCSTSLPASLELPSVF